MSLGDWRERIRTDPRATLAALLRRFAAERAETPGVEDLFWRAVVDFGGPGDLASAVLGRLRSRPGRLLDLDREHRVRARGRLRVAASETVEGFVRDPAERERIAHDPVRLADAAFARRKRPAEAAALHALEHDHLGSGAATTERLARAALRYELARTLQRVPGKQELAFEVMASVLPLIEVAETPATGRPEAQRSLAGRLSFHAREWLGLRHFEAGRYGEAEREFSRAAEAAPETDLALAAHIFAANALIRDGRAAQARRLLEAMRSEAGRVGRELSEQWSDLRRRLTDDPPKRDEDDEG